MTLIRKINPNLFIHLIETKDSLSFCVRKVEERLKNLPKFALNGN